MCVCVCVIFCASSRLVFKLLSIFLLEYFALIIDEVDHHM
jgi:hypothetical protein